MQYVRFELDDGSGDAALLVLPDYVQEPATFDVDLKFDDGSMRFINDEQEHTADDFVLEISAGRTDDPTAPVEEVTEL